MASEKGKSKDYDLDKTDKLPILIGAMFDAEADDAVPLDSTLEQSVRFDEAMRMDYEDDAEPLPEPKSSLPATSARNVTPTATTPTQADFVRPSAVDLPALAESMRSVEQRIAQQHADYETLSRNYERALDAEKHAAARASLLEQDLNALRSALELEQARSQDQEKSLQERHTALEIARGRVEQALLDMERHQSESKTLRDSLASRDATIVEVLHSLGERDTQLSTLQQQHVKLQSAIDEQHQVRSNLEEQIRSTKSRVEDLSRQLSGSSDAGVALSAKVRRTEAEVNSLRSELGASRAASSSYLEVLQTREFKRGFDENLFRELDAKVGAAYAGHSTLESERDRLRAGNLALEKKLAEYSAQIEQLRAVNAAHGAKLEKQTADLKVSESTCTDLSQKFASAESERARLAVELAERNALLAEARAAASGDVQRINQKLEAAERRETEHAAQVSQLHADYSAKIGRLQSEHADAVSQLQNDHVGKVSGIQADYITRTSNLQSEHATQIASLQDQYKAAIADLTAQAEEREQEMTVLMAHLKEARRPLEPIEGELKRLNEELSGKTKALEALSSEAAELRGSLERTKGALEEREFLIRRLERAESNNANVLGRIQTSMERLGTGSAAAPPPPPAALPEWSAELVRVDGDRNISHTLSRRTRIGRAAGCELQVDSSSVSRHHALIVAGPRETVVEDLNSTNGVILNGRKISRAFLNDGDLIVIGDVHFRYAAKPGDQQPPLEPTEAAS